MAAFGRASSGTPRPGFRPTARRRSAPVIPPVRCRFFLALCLAVGAPTVQVAHAQSIELPDAQLPLQVDADTLTYDRAQDIAIAEGNVRITYGDRTLIADRVTYVRPLDVMTAVGSVQLIEPTGDVALAEYVEITGDLRQAYGDGLAVLFADGSRFAAVQGERYDDNVTVLDRAVFSPCDVCEDSYDGAPLWQIRALRIVHDQQAGTVHYEDAVFEVLGVPVLYAPYFSHPDPTVRQRTGVLQPTFGIDGDLGAFFRLPIYYAIDESQDLTFEVVGSTRRIGLLGAEYRRRFETADLVLSGSATYTTRGELDDNGDTEATFRGHLFGDFSIDLTRNWRAGADIALASDDTFLREFNFSSADILRNRLFAEWFSDENYALAEGRFFQDLRSDVTEDEPLVLPSLRLNLTERLDHTTIGGRLFLNAGVRAITREDGLDSQRLDMTAGWRRNVTTPVGLIGSVNAQVVSILSGFQDTEESPIGSQPDDDGTEFRLLPTLDLMARYPFARDFSTVGEHVVEPIVQFVLAPRLDDPDGTPNDDARDIEFEAANLFDVNRFTGLDRLESGVRLNYGLNQTLTTYDGGYVGLFIGQSLRLSGDETILPAGSGINDDLSDLVGRLQLILTPEVDVDYRFRLDLEGLDSARHEIRSAGQYDRFTLSGTYVFAEGISTALLEDQHQIAGRLTTRLTDEWSFDVFHRQDLGADPDPLRTGVTLSYANECCVASLTAQRDFTDRPGLDGGDSILLNISLRGLGSF